MNEFGKRLKTIRNNKGYPQKVIADALKITRPSYSKIENNQQKMTAEQLKFFCEFCDVSADELLRIHISNKVTLSEMTVNEIDTAIEYLTSAQKAIKNS